MEKDTVVKNKDYSMEYEEDNYNGARVMNKMPITSFEQVEALAQAERAAQLTTQLTSIVNNIASSPNIEDKGEAIATEVETFRTMFANLKNKGIKDTVVGLFSKGHPKVEDEEEIIEKTQEDKSSSGTSQGVTFKKNKNGTVSWLAVYSNNFRDEDAIPEIISEASHKNFDRLLKENKVDYPELWLHHIPGTCFGKATFNAYDDNGFSIAAGYIYPDKVWVVDHLEKIQSEVPLGVSHGMPSEFIRREDASDPTVITHHITTEISLLPMDAAANKMTNFFINSRKVEDKRMTEEEKDILMDGLKFKPEVIQSFESGNKTVATQAIEAGVESKEATKVSADTAVIKEDLGLKELTKKVDAITQSLQSQKTSDANIAAVLEVLVKQVSVLTIAAEAQTAEIVKEKSKTELGSDNFDLGSYFKQIQATTANSTPLQETDALYNDGPTQSKQASPVGATGIPLLDGFIDRKNGRG